MAAQAQTSGLPMAGSTAETLPTKAQYLANLAFASPIPTDPCCICSSPFDARPSWGHGGDLSDEPTGCAMTTPCGHVFGEDCLVEWANQSNSCPMCRTVLFAAEPADAADLGDLEQYPLLNHHDAVALAGAQLAVVTLGLPVLERDDDANVRSLLRQLRALGELRAGRGAPGANEDDLQSSIHNIQLGRVSFARLGQLQPVENRAWATGISGTILRAAELPPAAVAFEIDDDTLEGVQGNLMMFGSHGLERVAASLRPRQMTWPIELHHGTYQLMERAAGVVADARGRLVTAEQLELELVDAVKWFRGEGMPIGMEGFARDVVEVCVQAVCGMVWRFREPGEVSRAPKRQVLEFS